MKREEPLQPSDLIFPHPSTNTNEILGDLKRSNLTITNRLTSIQQDADFVARIAAVLQLPLVANERCGSWYIRPHLKAGSAYFKSTDGHFGQWGFSLRRLNLHVLELVGRGGGCVIVDSTRRGKSMPDALSKTVPIWIAVLNRVLFPELTGFHHLCTPSEVVSLSEHSQIEARLEGFVEALRGLKLNREQLRRTLSKPLRPVFVTPEDEPHLQALEDNGEYHNIVLCTASSRSSQAVHHSSGYVQGAADDSESWAFGLDARTFWAWVAELRNTPEKDLPAKIQLILQSRRNHKERRPTLIQPTSDIWISDNAAAKEACGEFDIIVSCGLAVDPDLSASMRGRYIHLTCDTGKNGSRQLRSQLPKLEILPSLLRPETKVLVSCTTGEDIAVGVALAIICQFCNDSGGKMDLSSDKAREVQVLNKTLIKQRLSWIMIALPDATPSRATLQSINAYLMG
ncbi:hypothetical protein LTR62_000368 [Meristemomyces frigidus]|uniref:Initiator tRNA phosphoribosyl transferase n=1 Tax=Meristemomyces frigidus TaxID=1508187 RepID=A0AAN7TMB7_9PEZI|nr:hypothetical protein LTR62_000368 [Meristemomyces frigidus]